MKYRQPIVIKNPGDGSISAIINVDYIVSMSFEHDKAHITTTDGRTHHCHDLSPESKRVIENCLENWTDCEKLRDR